MYECCYPLLLVELDELIHEEVVVEVSVVPVFLFDCLIVVDKKRDGPCKIVLVTVIVGAILELVYYFVLERSVDRVFARTQHDHFYLLHPIHSVFKHLGHDICFCDDD